MAKSRLETVRAQRIEKINRLRKMGIDPYPPRFDREQTCLEVNSMLGKKVKVAGRIMATRGHGKIAFLDLLDFSGKTQLWFQQDALGKDKFKLLKLVDVGDFLGIEGAVVKTKAGEISVDVTDFQILTKAILPLPDKWYGLKDVEERYRRRYLDLLMNPAVKEVFVKRAKIYQAIRRFLDEKGFLEVQTPILQAQYGGGNARPFVTRINAWDMPVYLRIAYELHLKRLIVGGFEGVYDLSSCFRNEGADKTHNPEFAMMEIQWAYGDYHKAMELTEQLWAYVAEQVLGTTVIEYGGNKIDLKPPWKRLTVKDALKELADIELDSLSDTELKKVAKKQGVEDLSGRGEMIVGLFEELCENQLIQPTHIIDHPKETCPLSRPHRDDPDLIERLEPYINGWEVGNCYSELIDPVLQQQLFEEQVAKGRAGDEEAHPMDADYVRALEHGLPPNVGLGVGIDRMVMLLTGAESIRDVMLFPIMRPEDGSPDQTVVSTGNVAINPDLDSKDVFSISPAVKTKFPEMKIGVGLITGIEVSRKHPELEALKKETLADKKELSLSDVDQMPSIKAYRDLFKQFGVDWHSRHPSVDALYRRVVQGKGLYNINTVVDAYNVASLKTGLGMAAINFDKVSLPVTLRLTQKGEQITLLGGDEVKTTKDGELVYADQSRIITLDLNYRDCDHTKITSSTRNILVFVDGCAGISEKQVKDGLDLMAGLITRFCSGEIVFKKVIF